MVNCTNYLEDSLVRGCMYGIIWLTGVFGNLINIFIFSRAGTTIRPGNTIPWWLSVNDLLQLVVIVSYQVCCKGCMDIGIFYHCTPFFRSVFWAWLQLANVYVLEVLHFTAVGLSFMLAFGRYMAAVDHPPNKFRDSHFVKRAVIWLYILSFVIHSSLFYMLTVYPESDYNVVKIRNSSEEGIDSKIPHINWCIIIYGFVLRLAPFAGLTVISAMFINVVMKTRRIHRLSGRQISLISTQQRRIDQIYIGTTVMVVVMFFMTEIPIGLASVLRLMPNSNRREWPPIKSATLPTLLVSSSTIFFYAMASAQYRRMLKSLLKNCVWFGSSSEQETDEFDSVNLPLRTLSRRGDFNTRTNSNL